MKIKFLKKQNNFKKKDFTLNPNLFWKIAVFGTFVLIILAAFFGYYLFGQINKEYALSTVGNSGQVPTVDRSHIEKVLNYFSSREEKSKEVLANPAPVVDPSL